MYEPSKAFEAAIAAIEAAAQEIVRREGPEAARVYLRQLFSHEAVLRAWRILEDDRKAKRGRGESDDRG